MVETNAPVQMENRGYGEPIRWNEEERCYYTQGPRLMSFESPDPVKQAYVERAIHAGDPNPLGDDLSEMALTEEQVRAAMVREGLLDPDHPGDMARTVLKRANDTGGEKNR